MCYVIMSRLLADQGAGGSRGSVGPRVLEPGGPGCYLDGRRGRYYIHNIYLFIYNI